jgi:hypothetical protein
VIHPPFWYRGTFEKTSPSRFDREILPIQNNSDVSKKVK